MAPLLIPLAISGSSRSTLIQLVEEKAERFKETQKNLLNNMYLYQKIMGLMQKSYITAWIASSYLKGIFSVFTFLIIPVSAGLAFIDNPTYLIIGYIIYYIASIHQSLCLSSLFSKTKMASEIGTVLTIIPIFLVFLVLVDSIRASTSFYWLLGLFPQCAISLSYMSLLNNSSMFYSTPPISDYFTSQDAVVLLTIDMLLYIILYFYLDEIVPNEYGVSRHPLFFIKNLFSKSHILEKRKR